MACCSVPATTIQGWCRSGISSITRRERQQETRLCIARASSLSRPVRNRRPRRRILFRPQHPLTQEKPATRVPSLFAVPHDPIPLTTLSSTPSRFFKLLQAIWHFEHYRNNREVFVQPKLGPNASVIYHHATRIKGAFLTSTFHSSITLITQFRRRLAGGAQYSTNAFRETSFTSFASTITQSTRELIIHNVSIMSEDNDTLAYTYFNNLNFVYT